MSSRCGVMRIAVFGATGKIGRHVVQQALAAGHQVATLVRDGGKLTANPGRGLLVVIGDLLDPGAVARVVTPVLLSLSWDHKSCSLECHGRLELTQLTEPVISLHPWALVTRGSLGPLHANGHAGCRRVDCLQ